MELQTAKFLQEKEEYEQSLPEPELPKDPDEHPWVYVHERCGGATQMPAHVRRNYLADPCYYFSFLGSVCASCGGPVPESQLYWTETGESLQDYMRRLKKSMPRRYHLFRYLFPLSIGLIVATGSAISLLRNGQPTPPVGFVMAIFFFAAFAWLPCRFVRLFLCRMKLI